LSKRLKAQEKIRFRISAGTLLNSGQFGWIFQSELMVSVASTVSAVCARSKDHKTAGPVFGASAGQRERAQAQIENEGD
jgi:hypothetical protein